MFFVTTFCAAQNEVAYDSTLARSLGADEYGMKSYTFIILKTGPDTVSDPEQRQALFSGHLKNIAHLAEKGDLVLAGPLQSNPKNYRGLFIFDLTDKKEVEELLQTDPAIAAGLLDYEIYQWYGSAALRSYLDTHEKIQKTKF
jgi:uncharacterized protein YciI